MDLANRRNSWVLHSPWKYAVLLVKVTGESRSKFWFYVILEANLVYFYPLFTEMKNFAPRAKGRTDSRGEGVRLFNEIWWPKDFHFHKRIHFNGLQTTEYVQKSVPEVENKWFCHTLLLGTRQYLWEYGTGKFATGPPVILCLQLNGATGYFEGWPYGATAYFSVGFQRG